MPFEYLEALTCKVMLRFTTSLAGGPMCKNASVTRIDPAQGVKCRSLAAGAASSSKLLAATATQSDFTVHRTLHLP